MFSKIVSGVKGFCSSVVRGVQKVKTALIAVGTGAAAVAVPEIARAEGEFTLAAPTIDMTLLGTLAATILGGLAAMWIVRKVIKTMNKS